jgi:hypothetical protein
MNSVTGAQSVSAAVKGAQEAAEKKFDLAFSS